MIKEYPTLDDVYELDVVTDYGLDAIAHWIFGDDSEDNAFEIGLYRGRIVDSWNKEGEIKYQINSYLLNECNYINECIHENNTDELQIICDEIDKIIENNL